MLDEELHDTLFRAIGCPGAAKRYECARVLVERARRLALPDEPPVQTTLAENVRIVDVISAGDAGLAAAAMRLHLSRVGLAIESGLHRLAKANVAPIVQRSRTNGG
jgi:DNA-binding GntR family transcriptional regulator